MSDEKDVSGTEYTQETAPDNVPEATPDNKPESVKKDITVKRKRNFKPLLIIAISIIAGAMSITAVAGIYFLTHSNSVVITREDGNVYRAKLALLTNTHCILIARGKICDNRKTAFDSEVIDGIEIERVDSIRIIQFTPNFDIEKEPETPVIKTKTTTVSVMGSYAVNVSGHRGTMVISWKGGMLTGTIQFPQWAKGQKEYLKKVRLNGNKISFTRSVETEKERSRIGAPTYFVQDFTGEISDGGKLIKGYFTNHGTKEMWEAERK